MVLFSYKITVSEVITITTNKKIYNWSEMTPQEQQEFYDNFTLSDKQVKEFARALYYSSDNLIGEIKAYVAEHQDEYQKFLEKEKNKKCENK